MIKGPTSTRKDASEGHKFSAKNYHCIFNHRPKIKLLHCQAPYAHEMSSAQVQQEKRGIYKNLFLISFAFLLLFVAFESMSKLQSSINVVGGLGVWSNAMVYASLILSCMFLPSIMIDKLTVKWALVVSVFCYSSYIAAQFYPEFYTLLPTAFVLGLGAAPMWSAKCTYLTQVAHR